MSKKFTPRSKEGPSGKRFGSKTTGSSSKGRSRGRDKEENDPGYSRDKKEFKPFSNRNTKKTTGASDRSRKPYSSKGEADKKPFSAYDRPRKSFGKEAADKPRRSFDKDDKKSFGSSSRPRKSFDKASEDKPRRSFDKDGEDKTSFSSRARPRKSFDKESEDKPRRSFDKDGEDKKSFSSRSRSPKSFDKASEDKPRRSFDKDGAGKKPFDSSSSTRKSFDKSGEDKPRRSFDGEEDKKSFRSNSRSPKSFDKEGEDNTRSFNKDDDTKGGNSRTARKPYTGKNNFKPTAAKAGVKKKQSFDDFDDKDFDNLPDDFNEEDIKPLSVLNKEGNTKKRKPSSTAHKTNLVSDEGFIRLNKYIANAGICSRREADDLIKSGVVAVNGKTITEMGFKVGPNDTINYGGQTLKKERLVYVLLNKPKDYITTMDDPDGRKNVLELVRNACRERIYPVGRLDRATTGLLMFTNDGEMTKKLTHPRYGIKKIYHVVLDKNVKKGDMKALLEGITLEDGEIKVDAIDYVGDGKLKNEVGVEIHSGRNRIIRRMFEHIGYKVVKLDRVYFAGLTKKNLSRGQWRYLTDNELSMLKMMASE